MFNWQDRLNPLAGGAEIHLHELFGRLAGRGHRVTLVTSGWAGSAARESLDGMEVHRVGRRHSYAVAAPAFYARRLRPFDFDVVVEDLNKVPLFSPYWVRRPLVLLVHHLFGGEAFGGASVPVATATWLLERPVPRVYRGVQVEAVSPSTARDLVRRGFDDTRIRVIPNGVDLDVYHPIPGAPRFEQPSVLYLGRIKRYKGVDLAIRAIAALRDRGCFVRLLIAGRGDYADALAALRRDLGLQDRVELLGFVGEEEKLDLFRRSWIHVLPSAKEGWGLTNLEAGACGTPTVASDSPGLRDSVVDGRTGFLVPHGDIGALASAIQRLVDDRELRERFGAEAIRFAREHGWERAADLTEAHLAEVADREVPTRSGRLPFTSPTTREDS